MLNPNDTARIPNWIISLIISGVVTWLTTWFYFRKQLATQRKESQLLKKLLQKLPTNIARALQADTREKLSVKELNELLSSKIINPDLSGLEAYKACPKCGAALKKTTDYSVDHDGEEWVGFPIEAVACTKCNWQINDEDLFYGRAGSAGEK